MSLRTVYQTLKFKNNNEEVLAHGPYDCTEANAWLHSGFYFWEEFIEPAHHWGKTYNKGNYIITSGECIIFEDQLFDLLGNTKHIRMFRETIDLLNHEGLINDNTTVAHVIDYLIKEDVFDFIATRANTTESFGKYNLMSVKFAVNRDIKLILNPAIQVCIYNLEKALFGNFQIIHENKGQISA
jgi:hypothetical protein